MLSKNLSVSFRGIRHLARSRNTKVGLLQIVWMNFQHVVAEGPLAQGSS